MGLLAAKQHGVVSRRQLAAIGIDDSGIRRRVAQGRLHRVHPGVYAVGYSRLTAEGRWMAAVLACGRSAVLSHLDAAALWRIYDGMGARVHVTVLSRRVVAGVWVHRARRLHPEDVTVRQEIPVTTAARTLVDLTATCSAAIASYGPSARPSSKASSTSMPSLLQLVAPTDEGDPPC